MSWLMAGWDDLGNIIEKSRERFPAFSRRLDEARGISFWSEAVGPHISKHTRVAGIKRGVLYIVVDHPIWKSELHHRKAQILEMLNQKASSGGERPAIADIFFLDPR